MLRRTIPVLLIFLAFLVFFVVQKPIFMFYNSELFIDKDWGTIWSVIRAGFSMDVSMACYLTAVPLLASIVATFLPGKYMLYFLRAYTVLFGIVVAIIYVVDMGLFSYWDFRLDTTPVFYFLSSPKSALASGTFKEYILALVLVVVYGYVIYKSINTDALRHKYWTYPTSQKAMTTLVLLLIGGVVFLGIRGGWTVSTMNTGRAYFSDNDRLNQAAINPAFSFMESLMKGDKLGKQYQFYKTEEMTALVEKLYERKAPEVSRQLLLNTDRPDIYIVVLESFSTALMNSKIDGQEITPELNALAKESVYFSNFYANSFRTDRGLTAILSGYPSQPSTSILKYPRKSSKLSGIGKLLKEVGYELNYFYGGDINFTNLNAYLKRQGFEHIVSDKDFPITEKLSKWGVHDHFVFERALSDITNNSSKAPQLHIIQTSSSHEPFEVPYNAFNEPKPNAFAYTDHCIGNFITSLRKFDRWDNSLVIFVPDHYGAYPEGIEKYEERRYEIPLIWTGGAILEPRVIDTIGSQMDIVSTVLGQLNISAAEIIFGNDMLDDNAPHFAYFSHAGCLGLIKGNNGFVYNLVTNEPTWKRGDGVDSLQQEGKALLQKIYRDIAQK